MTPFLGMVMFFAGEAVPAGWHACDGSSLPVDQYAALFSLIGTTYGGDGRTEFALPKLASPLRGGHYIIAITGSYPVHP